ncbi:MAG: tRNA (N6-isopentenyl adenosine(37)-C2)-methylthiotransferase MiaB [Patescibacteria group bacterium]|nr:tRNA (N6-isopentenyl adenosine(37)-C2)-methylthiotransferase MiaB [Patescibacteria group bacterium]
MKTFNIFVIGCQMNKSDSERIRGYLELHGLTEIDNPNQADFVILVTCGVRQSAEDRIFGLIPNWRANNKNLKIVLTGCLALREDVKDKLTGKIDVWLPIYDLPLLGNALGLKKQLDDNYDSLTYLSFEPHYKSNFSAFLPIGNGCNNFCSYCVVPYARGREVCRPYQDILSEAESLIKKGFKEIILIAQNVNSYKSSKDNGEIVDFADLVKMVDQIEGDWWLRFSTSHPKDMSEKLIKTIADGRHTCQYFHFAAQSGDDKILELMNRRYTAKHYLDLVDKIRHYSPEAMISTDIIVGFPGETDKQFNNSKKLMEAARFDMVYISQYSPRPGTVSARLEDDVSKEIKRHRETELNDILRKTALENNQKYLGRIVKVLVDEVEKTKADLLEASGKSADFKSVKFTVADKGLIGQFVLVKITKVREFAIYGEFEQ